MTPASDDSGAKADRSSKVPWRVYLTLNASVLFFFFLDGQQSFIIIFFLLFRITAKRILMDLKCWLPFVVLLPPELFFYISFYSKLILVSSPAHLFF